MTKATTLARGATISKASLVEVTVTVDIFVKVPIISRASLAETTVPMTQEWKQKGITTLIPCSDL